MTYTGADQKSYRLTGFVRIPTTTSVPVLLQAMHACPVDAYSSGEMETLLKASPISHPGPADVDEAESAGGSSDGQDGRSDDKKGGSGDHKTAVPSDKNGQRSSDRSAKEPDEPHRLSSSRYAPTHPPGWDS